MNPSDLIYLLLMLALAGAALMAWMHHRKWLRERHLDGLRWCGNLLELVLRLQQHRGMAAALLAGDASFRPGLLAKRREIDQLFQVLEGLPQHADGTIDQVASRELPELKQRWQALCHELDGLTSFASMTRHTAVIGTLLTWLRSIGEACIDVRTMVGEARLDYVVPVFVERLPALSETLGQIRALGSAVAASGGVSAAERVKLSYLVHRISELLGRSESALEHAGQLREAEVASGFAEVREKVQCLLDLVCRDLLEPSALTLQPLRYFNTATLAIDAVFALVYLLRQRLSGLDAMAAATQRTASEEAARPLLHEPLAH